MSDTESIKQQKMERLVQMQQQKQMQARMQNQMQEVQEMQQQIQQLEIVIKPLLSKEAWGRYTTLRVGHPEKAVQALVALAQLAQSGNVRAQLTDEQFKQVLVQITPVQKQTKINFA